MKNYSSRAFLKARARESLMGHYLTFAGAFLLLFLLRYIAVIPTSIMNITPPVGMVLYYALNFGLELFYAIFKVGLAYLFLSNACGQRIAANGIFMCFWNTPGKAVCIQLLPSLLLLVPNIVPDFCLMQFFASRDQRWLIYGLAAALILLPYTIYIEILYSQVFYVMLDFPEMEASECLRSARRLMKGNMWRFFVLRLSFLPLTLLAMLTCGIGLLYVYPYRQQTYANFYLDLMAKRSGN